MWTAISIAEAAGAIAGFCWLAVRHDRARAALKHANWRAARFQSMLERRERRAAGQKARDVKGRFA